ncbi:hypothetical protein VTK26DRAFT_5904 [Humicola hyalothermophila]
MAPQQFRTATQTRRSARTGFPEPDDFEGLPVRQWRQEWVNAAPSLQQEITQQGDRWAVELPYGMPRESHLLPPHSQELLRAARSGRLYKRPAPPEEEEADAELDAVKGDKKDWEAPSDGFMVKKWKQVSRSAETPTISYLAKRHKNTVTLASKAVATQPSGPTMIRATVRRIDAAGNPYEQTVNLTEGQQVDGEIISTTVVPAPSATQGEAGAQQHQPTPVRRRPPPPKRKAKGLRGRRKGKLPLPPPATRSNPAAADGAPSVKLEGVGTDGIKAEDTEDSANQDGEMADASGMQSEDEEGEGGEGEDDEEGEEEGGEDKAGETPEIGSVDGGAQDQDIQDTEMSEAVQPSSIEEPAQSHRPASEVVEEVTIPKARFQPLSLGSLGPPHSMTHTKMEGSPLKNVMIQSPTEPSPAVPSQTADASIAASSSLEAQPGAAANGPNSSTSIGQTETIQGVLGTSGQPSEHVARARGEEVPSGAEEASAQPLAAEQSKPEPAPAQSRASPTVEDPTTAVPPPPTTDSSQPAPARAGEAQAATEISLRPPDSPALLPTVTAEEEDDGLSLLGSLERELNRQEGMSSASSGSGDHKVAPPSTTGDATAPMSDAMVTDAPVVSGDDAPGNSGEPAADGPPFAA